VKLVVLCLVMDIYRLFEIFRVSRHSEKSSERIGSSSGREGDNISASLIRQEKHRVRFICIRLLNHDRAELPHQIVKGFHLLSLQLGWYQGVAA
jgi:hypothetical protein